MQTLVAGIDSSTQSCKVTIRDAATGRLIRTGSARHTPGTEVDPEIWWMALQEAIQRAGGIADVAAISIAGQQHGMIALDADGRVVRDALLWNDTRSGDAAEDLVKEIGAGDLAAGRVLWAEKVGLVPVASFTATKIRWMAQHEPENFARTAAIALPHDWLTWKLRGETDIATLTTDRSDASGTGYFDSVTNQYREDILELIADGASSLVLPRVAGPNEAVGIASGLGSGAVVGPGMGDNAGAALGLDLNENEPILSIGTSGVVTQVLAHQTSDPSGEVAGFADATGRFLPLVATLNASRVLDAYTSLLGVDHEEFARLALSAPAGSGGLTCVPYFEGERTPNYPVATGSLHGITLANFTPANIARAAVEGMLCGVGEGIQALKRLGAQPKMIRLIGGGAQSEAVRRVAPTVFGIPVIVPEHGEYVAEGAARQASWTLTGGSAPPNWLPRPQETYNADHRPEIQHRFDKAKHLFLNREQQPV